MQHADQLYNRGKGWISRSIPSDLAHIHTDKETDKVTGDYRTAMEVRQEIDRGEGLISRSIPSIPADKHLDDKGEDNMGVVMDTDS